ncbi:hypothetical protein L1887_37265 [Cichorium endivia]|nr:hypothetical protein L1887_37265 [Cichorium endivia]
MTRLADSNGPVANHKHPGNENARPDNTIQSSLHALASKFAIAKRQTLPASSSLGANHHRESPVSVFSDYVTL